jgi:hypothetical protein
MDYKNLSIAELRAIETKDMDDVQFGEWLKENQKARGIATDAKKAQRDAFRAATEASVKPTDASVKDLDLSWNTENKVTYKVTVQTVNGKNKVVDFNMSGNHASPTTSVYAGYTFTIDGLTDIHFTADSSLNWGEFNLTDIVKLSSAKRVVSYFGVAVRGSEFKEDGVTKSNEATSTPYLATKLTPEQIERVAVVKDGESIALADFLASLS